MKERSFLWVIALLSVLSFGATWPTDTVRTKNWGSEVLTDSDLEAQYDVIHTYIDDMMDESTGHKHDATVNEGPLLELNDDNGVIAVTGTLGVVNGGTGLATLTDGGILLGSGTGLVTPMAVLADGEIVVGDGTTDPVALAAFTSSTGDLKHESGGLETDISAVVKGDLIAGTGTGSVGLLNVGSDGKALVADSGEATGLKYADFYTVTQASTTGSGTGGGSSIYSDILSQAKTITNGNTVFVMASFKMDGGSSADSNKVKIIHGSTDIQEYTGLTTDTSTHALHGIVTGLSGSVTFKLQAANAGTGQSISDAKLTIIEFGPG